MGIYLKFLGIIILFSGLLLGGLALYPVQDYQSFEQKLTQINKKYEKIGKDLDTIIDKSLERFILFRHQELQRAKGIALIIGGVLIGSIFLGLGKVITLLKKISRQ